jgi:CCR4-NOT transcription complex subunit 1
MFMPKLLLSKGQKGWPLMQRLLVGFFQFLHPYLSAAELSPPVRMLYRGALRILLVLLHDFPEFLCDYHLSFCDVIPPSCIQMRNLVLSAFPRNMRLPDPFTPNLKVDLLPEISQPPRILSAQRNTATLTACSILPDLDQCLKTRSTLYSVVPELRSRLIGADGQYRVNVINALVLHVGQHAIASLQSQSQLQQVPALSHSAPMELFQRLATDLNAEGRYLFLNAVANQLRYPNNHTHYFSCVLLCLFSEATDERVQEQITRVLVERLIVHRPHPWGLLITFIELIKNPRFNFWSKGFTRCAPEIERLFESVARSCMTTSGASASMPGAMTNDEQ